jgi:hypothetical protein
LHDDDHDCGRQSVLALDLGKYKSVAYLHDHTAGAFRFTSFVTSRGEVERLVASRRRTLTSSRGSVRLSPKDPGVKETPCRSGAGGVCHLTSTALRVGVRRSSGCSQPNGPSSSNSFCALMVSATDDALMAA